MTRQGKARQGNAMQSIIIIFVRTVIERQRDAMEGGWKQAMS
jgi:hypothetical protein